MSSNISGAGEPQSRMVVIPDFDGSPRVHSRDAQLILVAGIEKVQAWGVTAVQEKMNMGVNQSRAQI
jgi:hypothetical protein